MKYYEVSETEVKVPAGWLIEQAGFKGKRYGDAEFTKPSFSISELWHAVRNPCCLKKYSRYYIQYFFGIHIEAEVNVI
jgi:UDP-N-acetylmuramate dehydrogenase